MGGYAFLASDNILTELLHLRLGKTRPEDLFALGRGVLHRMHTGMDVVVNSGLMKPGLSSSSKSSDFIL